MLYACPSMNLVSGPRRFACSTEFSRSSIRSSAPSGGATESATSSIGLLHANGSIYVGHPNGAVGWTRDLQAAAGGVAHYYNGTLWPFNATPLGVGSERDAVIRSTGQHPFPGNLVYRLGRGHVRRAGIFFRLTDRETAAQ